MKLRAVIRFMLHMKERAWRVFLRCLQLSCFFLLCSAFLLIAREAVPLRSFSLFQLSLTMQEMAQLSLLGAVILPPCLQELPD